MDLAKKVCLITGGTRGIGAATALVLAKAGADIALVARRSDEHAKEVVHAIESLGRKCSLTTADIADPIQVKACVEAAVRQFGSVDVLVHSAGGAVPGGLMDVTEEAWQGAFDVHVHAAFHLSRAVVPMMKQRKEGAIVFISSTAGIRGVRGALAYQVVKGALPQMTRGMAFELAGDNIRVNCVAPGVIRTDFHSQMTDAVKKNNVDNRIPLHREGTPEQVASLVKEMIGNDFITGETFSIDGGMTMRIC